MFTRKNIKEENKILRKQVESLEAQIKDFQLQIEKLQNKLKGFESKPYALALIQEEINKEKQKAIPDPKVIIRLKAMQSTLYAFNYRNFITVYESGKACISVDDSFAYTDQAIQSIINGNAVYFK